MSKAIKYAEKAAVYAAQGAWVVFERLNRISPNAVIHAQVERQAAAEELAEGESRRWAGREPLTRCVRSACRRFSRSRFWTASCRTKSCSTRRSARSRRRSSSATAQILMVKDCPKHGHFEDVMSIDTAVLQAPGRELPRAATCGRTARATKSCTITAPRRSLTGAARC
jgi:hypothetical protein